MATTDVAVSTQRHYEVGIRFVDDKSFKIFDEEDEEKKKKKKLQIPRQIYIDYN